MSFNVVCICKRLQLSIVLTGDLKDGLSKNGLSSDFWFRECHLNIDQSLFIKSLKDTRRNNQICADDYPEYELSALRSRISKFHSDDFKLIKSA